MVVVAVLAGGSLVLVPGVAGTFQDDGIYVATARALAEGHGYRLLNLPDAPPQTRYPILYPALLSAAWWCGGDLGTRITAMQVLTLVLAALGVGGAGLLLRRFGYVGRASALGGGLLAAASPAVLYFSTQVLSEMPFALALVAAVWRAERWLRDETHAPARDIGTGMLLALPFLCRSIGIVVAPPVLVLGWLRGRRVFWVAFAALVTAGPWLWWTVIQANAEIVDVGLGPQTGYLGWWTWTGLLLDSGVVTANLRRAMESFGYLGLSGIAALVYTRVAFAGLVMTALGVVAWFALGGRLSRLEALPAVLLVYLGVVAVWPWPPERFIVPLVPFLLPAFCEAFDGVARRAASPRLGARRAGRLATTLVAAGVVVALWLDGRELALRHHLARAWGYPYLGVPETPVAWQSFADAFAWLEQASAPGDVIASGFDSMTALYTGRAAFRPAVLKPRALYHDDPAPLGTVADLRAILKVRRPRFLFVSPMPDSPEEQPLYVLVDEAQRRWPEMLRLAYRGGDPRFLVFEVSPDAGTS